MNQQQFLAYLRHHNCINDPQLHLLQQIQSHDICCEIVERGFCDADTLAAQLARDFAMPYISLDETVLETRFAEFAKTHRAIPIKKDDSYYIAIADPNNVKPLTALQQQFNITAKPAITTVNQLLKHCQQQADATDDNATIIIDKLFSQAIHQGASDIHFEPQLDGITIRMRIDGLLQVTQQFNKRHSALINRLKIMAKLDISEQRLPQDGQIVLNPEVNCRVSTCPTLYGEKIVCRLLCRRTIPQIHQLGMQASQQQAFQQAIEKPQGLILVTGPTGSGKTITLYSALQHCHSPHKNLCSVEDPVEIPITGINQMNIRDKIGLDFASALRTLLRQDPDIIMIGEIRDQASASMAVRAAQTGHLVFATLHANDCSQAITRLRFLGISADLIAYSLNMIVAQRLLRKKNGKGRIAIFETLEFSADIQEQCLQQDKMIVEKTLAEHGQALVASGQVDLSELKRVLNP